MKIKTFILIAALWANIAISDNSKTNQFFEFFNSVLDCMCVLLITIQYDLRYGKTLAYAE
jgi:hypothetical protein